MEEYINRAEGYSPSTNLEMSGGSRGQEQLLQETPSYQATMLTARQAGFEGYPREEGALETIARWLTRASSASTGAISGALGRTRYTEEGGPEYVGVGERASTARERFMRGWNMEDYYSWSDFGALARKRSEGKELTNWESAYNFGKGIVLDTISDPLTYVSFGGSILGRVGAAPIVRNKAGKVLLSRVMDPAFDGRRFVENIVEQRIAPISSRGVANRMTQLFEASADTGVEALDNVIKAGKFDPNLDVRSLITQIDERIEIINRVALEEGVDLAGHHILDPFKYFAMEKVPDIAGYMYTVRGIGGAKRWINKTLGADAGRDFWNALPNDIKGGLRIRMPFYRKSDGSALAFRVPGIGGGELTERLGKMGINLEPAVEATERGRDLIRQVFLSFPGGPSLLYKGRGSQIIADAVLGATGNRRLMRITDKIRGTSKATDAFTDLVDYGDFTDAIWKSQNMALNFSQEITELHYATMRAMNEAFDVADEAEKDQVVEMFWDILGDAGPKVPTNELEERAHAAAAVAKVFFDKFADEAIEVTKDGRIAFNRLNYYAPRRANEQNLLRRLEDSPGYGGVKGAKTQNIKSRQNDVSLWGLSQEGDAFVLRFKGPHQIYRAVGDRYEEIYIKDPLSVMGDYAESFIRTLDDLRLAGMLKRAGLFTPEQVKRIDAFDENFIEENLVRILGGTAGGPSANRGKARKTYNEILARLADSGLEDDVKLQSTGQYIAEQMPGMGVITRDQIDLYVPSDVKDEWINRLDGTRIKYEFGRYAVKDFDGSNFLDPNTGRPLVFDNRQAAEAAMAPIMQGRRAAYWNNRLAKDVAKTVDILEDMLDQFPDGYHRIWTQVEDDMQSGAISVAEGQRRKDALSDKAMDWLRKFGMDEAVDFNEETLEVNWKRGKYRDYKVKDEIRRIVAGETLYSQEMIGGGGRIMPRSKVEIQARVVEHIGTVYAPKAMMDTFVRMFQVASGSKLDDFIKSTYYPYYSAVRSWLTVGRGPGFVLRNIQGGMWNNYINGVGVVQHKAAGIVLLGKFDAQKEAIELLGKDASAEEIGQKTFEIFKDSIAKSYKGSDKFVEGMSDAEALTEIYQLANKTGLIGGRSGRLANELVTYGNYSSLGPFSGLTRKNREEMIKDYAYRRIPDANEPVTREITKREEILYKIGFDNKWIRDIMSPAAGLSEDYLRLAAFIKGVQEMGLEPVESGLRGFAASTWVKGSQFDYQDLSYFEQRYMKNILTFYTWARNNVPLQVRAFIHTPGHIANALRVHRGLAQIFQDDDKELSPSYVNNQLMFEIDKSKFDWLPDIIEPRYDVAFGIPWADPITDVNRWLKIPGVGNNNWSPIRREELPQNLNPLITAFWSLFEATTRGADFDDRDYGELAWWTQAVPGGTRMNYGDAQLGVEGGQEAIKESRRSIREALVNLVPPLGLAERLIPGFGDARQQNRLLTSWVSAVAGLPFVTVDDYQVAAQMRRDREGYREALEEMFGDTAEYRIAMNKALMDRGATLDFIRALDAAGVPRNEVDVSRARHAWELYRNYKSAIDNGADERNILAAMYAYSGSDETANSLVEAIWDAIPAMAERGVRYRRAGAAGTTAVTTDEQEMYRLFSFSPLTDEEKDWLGLTTEEIDDMSPAERVQKIIRPILEKRRQDELG